MSDSLNFCLTFESGLSSVITGLSRQLSLGLTTDYVLSPEALPHVTIMKISEPSSRSAEVWEKLAPSLPPRLALRFEGLRFMPGKGSGLWVEICVARTAELQLLQELASRHLRGYNTRTAVGDAWRPHVSLLGSVNGQLPAHIPLDRSLLLAEEVIATPTLGRDIAPGVLTDILHRPEF